MQVSGSSSESGQSWSPSHLQGMLLAQRRRGQNTYNEVIISSIDWQHALPRMVEAFVIIDGAWSRESDLNGEARARGAHAAFVQRFGADDPTVAHVPILRYGGGERGGFEEVQVQVRRRMA